MSGGKVILTLKITPEEKRDIKIKAAFAGMTVSKFVAWLVNRTTRESLYKIGVKK